MACECVPDRTRRVLRYRLSVVIGRVQQWLSQSMTSAYERLWTSQMACGSCSQPSALRDRREADQASSVHPRRAHNARYPPRTARIAVRGPRGRGGLIRRPQFQNGVSGWQLDQERKLAGSQTRQCVPQLRTQGRGVHLPQEPPSTDVASVDFSRASSSKSAPPFNSFSTPRLRPAFPPRSRSPPRFPRTWPFVE